MLGIVRAQRFVVGSQSLEHTFGDASRLENVHRDPGCPFVYFEVVEAHRKHVL